MQSSERRSYNAVRTQDHPSPPDTGNAFHGYSLDDSGPTGGPAGRSVDSFSVHSRTPLSKQASNMSMPQATTQYPPMPDAEARAGARPTPTHRPSWDLLSGIKSFEAEYEGFDSRKASESHLAFAEGDIPNTKVTKLYHYLLNASVVTRWILFIVPILALLWIPGIVGLTAKPNARIWGVKLLWWSVWFSVVWGGWWGALAIARILPGIARRTVGVVAVGLRRYIDWFDVLDRYVTFFAWSLTIWITFQPLINDRSDVRELSLIAKILFGIFLCAAVLLAEKFAIQWIAGKFHEKSYAERIAEQKFAIRVLTVLYRNSRDIPGRSDTLGGVDKGHKKGMSLNPSKFFKRALRNVRFAATTTTTALGNVASEMAGTSVLQPNSPQAMVLTAIHSLNKTRLLARRLFYSFAPDGKRELIPENIAPFFETVDLADQAFALFDKDGNGDVTRDELEDACIGFHREQLSIEHSMRDLDSAVGRLDNILISVYFLVCVVIIAVVLDSEVVTLITGAGTLIIGLSWLVGGSLTEVLTSIIFLFIKHPYDVGDRVMLTDKYYTVKEIRLLSTIFLDENGTSVQAPNAVISNSFIHNIRRSGQMSETFTFDVAYDTSFEQLEALRNQMLAFLKHERRDFLPSFDLTVVDIPDQDKMSLRVDIRYKSNWQQTHIKAVRRNKWICTLKAQLANVKIYGPAGGPDSPAGPSKYTLVPYEKVIADEEEAAKNKPTSHAPERMPTDGWDINDAMMISDPAGDIFDEASERNMTEPRRGMSSGPSRMPMPQPSSGSTRGMPTPSPMATPGVYRTPAEEYIEMRPAAPGMSRSESGFMEHRE